MELMSVYLGGIEANLVMAENIRRNILQNRNMSFQDAMLFLGCGTDFQTYVLFEDNGSFDDVEQYLSMLNMNVPEENCLSKGDLVLPSIFSVLLDPFTLQSFSKLIGQYLVKGQSSFSAPSMLNFGKVGFLPYYSFEPGADGLRHCLNTYLRTDRHLYFICLHKGAYSANEAFGLQVKMNGFSMMRNTLSFDLDLRYWRSDPLAYHDNTGNIQSTELNGALVGFTLYFQFLPDFASGRKLLLLSGCSLKSPGYTKGFPLKGGLSYHFGLGISV